MSGTLKTGGGGSQERLIDAWSRAAERVFERLTKVKPALQWKPRQTGAAATEAGTVLEWWEVRYEGLQDQRVWMGVASPAAIELGRLAHALVVAGEKDSESPAVKTTIESLGEAFGELLAQETGQSPVSMHLEKLAEPPAPAAVYEADITLPEGVALPILVGFNEEMKERFAPPISRQTKQRQSHHALGKLFDLELPLRVRFGQTRLALERVLQLQVGSVLELEGSAEDPVDLLVNGNLVARGEVVAIDGYYGVRILEVTGGDQYGAPLQS